MSEIEINKSRRCNKCGSAMQTKANGDVEQDALWGKKGLDFECKECDEIVNIGSAESALTGLLSGGFMALALLYFSNDIFDFIGYSLGGTFVWILVAIGLLLVFLAFCYGTFLNLKDGVLIVVQRYKYPLYEPQLISNKLVLNLALGFAPLVFIGLLAFINQVYFSFDRSTAYILLPLVFSPIILARKFKTTLIGVFLACLFWAVVGGLLFWIYMTLLI